MPTLFSTRNRRLFLEHMCQQPLDVLVVGGGITGAGIALDASTRGMRTGLLDMQDFAAGTSSRSTKLIHGGLRYLKQMEIKLVAETGRERRIVYENAPHVTRPEPMLLPLVAGGSLSHWSAWLGLAVYDRLAGVGRTERRRMLSRAETLAREPLLDARHIVGGAHYYEYRTDDARLTLEVLKEAVARGGLALNYLKVTGFLYENNKISGVTAHDMLTSETHEIHARVVVNATGPWVDTLDVRDHPAQGGKLYLTKGVHVVVPHHRLPIRQAVYFDVPGGRMVFAIPRAGKTYIGTTDTPYEGDLAEPPLLPEDRDYLLQAANHLFAEAALVPADVESHWAGVRPLIRQPGRGPSEISRRDEIFQYPSGLISIAGGKLTGYRRMAQRIVDIVGRRLHQAGNAPFPACHTHRIRLSGGNVGGPGGFEAFVRKKTGEGVRLGLPAPEAESLTRLYGSNVDHVYAYLAHSDNPETGLPPALLAQVQYSLEHEMAVTAADFFIRRTGAMYFQIDWMRRWEAAVATCMAQALA